MKEIAELLKITREQASLELEEVSKDLDIELIYLQNIEDGKIGSFKDIFTLKEYLSAYAKYLGLDEEDVMLDFNEYIFEYTSKIPTKEIEKAIKENDKNEIENPDEKIISPYTKSKHVSYKFIYIALYVLLAILVLLLFI